MLSGIVFFFVGICLLSIGAVETIKRYKDKE